MQPHSLSQWFEDYLDSFAACGRGERETESLVEFYGVPLMLSTDAGYSGLITQGQVVTAIQQQIDGLRAAAYSRSEILDSHVNVLNPTFAVYEGTFSRRRTDGSEIGRPTITYILTDGVLGRRISAIAIHSS
jgi:hypothetical protein